MSGQQIVDDFNERYPIGTAVIYRGDVPPYSGTVTTTRSEASLLGGHTAVVWLEGRSGCVALSHVVVVEQDAACPS